MVKKQRIVRKNKENLFLKHAILIRDSAKEIFSKNILKFLVHDFLFVLLSTLLILSSLSIIQTLGAQALPRAQEINQMQLSGDPAYEEALADFQPVVNVLILKTMLILTATIILELIIISFLYSKPWSWYLKKKFGKNNFFKSFFSTLILTMIILTLMMLFAILLNEKIAIILWFFLTLIFSCIWQLTILFSQEDISFKKIMKNSVVLFFKKINEFLIYLVSTVIIFLALFSLLSLLANMTYLFLALNMILIILIISFSRNYLCKLVASMKKGGFNAQ